MGRCNRDAIGVSGARGVYSCNHDVDDGWLVVEVLGVVMTALKLLSRAHFGATLDRTIPPLAFWAHKVTQRYGQ